MQRATRDIRTHTHACSKLFFCLLKKLVLFHLRGRTQQNFRSRLRGIKMVGRNYFPSNALTSIALWLSITTATHCIHTKRIENTLASSEPTTKMHVENYTRQAEGKLDSQSLSARMLLDSLVIDDYGTYLYGSDGAPKSSISSRDHYDEQSGWRKKLGQKCLSKFSYGYRSNMYILISQITKTDDQFLILLSHFVTLPYKADSECSQALDGAEKCNDNVCACSSAAIRFGNAGCLSRTRHFGDRCLISAQCSHLGAFAACFVSLHSKDFFLLFLAKERILLQLDYAKLYIQNMYCNTQTARRVHLRADLSRRRRC